jgi:glutathione S-transferase
MQLYTSPLSPFAARVRAALYFKRLPFVDLGVPEQGLKSPGFLAMNPIGKIPVLLLEGGDAIVESETILDYLEDAFPQPPLMPATPSERAKVRTLIRVTDNYITPPTARLFPHLDPSRRDAAVVTDELKRMGDGIRYLDHYLPNSMYAHGTSLTLADCCVFPSLYLCEIITAQLGVPDVFQAYPSVSGYFAKARNDEHLGRVHEEITTALRAYRQ